MWSVHRTNPYVLAVALETKTYKKEWINISLSLMLKLQLLFELLLYRNNAPLQTSHIQEYTHMHAHTHLFIQELNSAVEQSELLKIVCSHCLSHCIHTPTCASLCILLCSCAVLWALVLTQIFLILVRFSDLDMYAFQQQGGSQLFWASYITVVHFWPQG